MHHLLPNTDSFLYAELKNRNPKAFEHLYDHYSAALYGVIYQILKTEEDTNDALQEVFIKIWKSIDGYDPDKSSLYTWMLNIARNQAIDKTRSKSAKAAQLLGADKSYTNGRPKDASLLVDAIGLEKLTKTLDVEQQKVINLVYYQGFTQTEVADALNIPLGTVKSRVRLAIRELRKFFSE